MLNFLLSTSPSHNQIIPAGLICLLSLLILYKSCLLLQTIDNDQPYFYNDNGCKNKFWG
jgi:hypothetical protein